ncbi:fasciclin domain-containing protein [Methanoculleus sp. Wushi-C6]|uniref:Fasciclin domain-containing protein n=1 Tax=Methanoculleus caldifontis TaxID=2651577 RepID=A0ABU3X426_9EURY|nr:fasciclin domain-containing protein [Methanoculleus sp. Wushi-C6]MDV2482812.1 fasciclin domain-containing protein [Methanoculleus sp. Wushi-C6]
MKDIVETAREDGRLSISVRMLEAGGLTETLRGGGPYTAFFPTDEAFSRFPDEALDAIANDRGRLNGMILYHVVRGKLTIRDLSGMEAITTLQGDYLEIEAGEGMRVNNAAVVQPDVECTNGIYHVIDRVLLPRAVEARMQKAP